MERTKTLMNRRLAKPYINLPLLKVMLFLFVQEIQRNGESFLGQA
jgi:hypothetical protein